MTTGVLMSRQKKKRHRKLTDFNTRWYYHGKPVLCFTRKPTVVETFVFKVLRIQIVEKKKIVIYKQMCSTKLYAKTRGWSANKQTR